MHRGLSPWESRFGGRKFHGQRIPFGALVDFRPSPIQGSPAKFSPRATPGVFLGYVLQPGGRWRGDYLAAKLSDFASGVESNWRSVSIHRIREAVGPENKNWEFPLRSVYDERRRVVQLMPPPPPAPEVALTEPTAVWGPPPAEPAEQPLPAAAPDVEGEAPVDAPRAPAENPSPDKEPVRIMGRGTTNDPKDYPGKGVWLCPGGTIIAGRFVRKQKNTTRALHLWPEEWRGRSEVRREDALAQWEVALKAFEASEAATRAPAVEAEDPVPAMPVQQCNPEHRELNENYGLNYSALVARSVSRREVEENSAAKASVLKEWDKLRAAGCWDESRVREWSDVAVEARNSGQKAHVGRIFEICVEKGSELPSGDPGRKFKGRVVFQGNNVRDENWQAALFNEMSSAPASMEASKACDAFGLFPGHATQQCDAEQAYIQSKLEGSPTWVRLPKERWPAQWSKFKDPVCPLVLALYGHPDAGGCWEKHCEERLRGVGFKPIRDWRSCF